MVTKTKYNVGDTVFTLKKGIIKGFKVSSIKISINQEDVVISYDSEWEWDLHQSKKEAAEYWLLLNGIEGEIK